MRIKLDEDLPGSLCESFERYGHRCQTVVQQGWGGTADESLWTLVQSEQEFFVTADLGFGDLRRYGVNSHHGLLIIRSKDQRIETFRRLVQAVLMSHRLEDHVGHVLVVTAQGIRIRHG